jgi:alcohol dehydrogenase class IV
MAAFFTAPAIAWGPGAVEQLSALGAHRALVVVDPPVARAGVHVRAVEELGKSETVVEVVTDLSPLDAVAAVDALAERARSFAPDWIVAIGGGRTIDGAKAARLRYERPDFSWEARPALLGLPEPPRSRLVALPTTSGSGAEASWTADLTGADGSPLEVAGRDLVPSWALVDARLADSLPPAELLSGAVETAGQAIEAYLSAWSNPFSDALATDALLTVLRRLARAVRWSDDPDARSALHYAATEAGLASSNAQRGLAHALARALVGPTGLSYARLVGIVLPPVLEYDRPAARDRLEALDAALSSPSEPSHPPLASRLRRMYDLLRLPADLPAAGVTGERLAGRRSEIVARTLRSPAVLANPRVPTAADVGALLDAVAGGAVP